MYLRIIIYIAFLGTVLSKAQAQDYTKAQNKLVEAISKKYGSTFEKKGREILEESGISEDYLGTAGVIGNALGGSFRAKTEWSNYHLGAEINLFSEKLTIDFKTEF